MESPFSLAPSRRVTLVAATLLAFIGGAALAQDCRAVDWTRAFLPGGGDPIETAIETAYPGSDLDWAAGIFTTPDGLQVPAVPASDATPAERLAAATFGDQFTVVYPLEFDLSARLEPWADPGRYRDEGFLRALYGDSAEEVRQSLVRVGYNDGAITAEFFVTSRHCVYAQLQAALDRIENQDNGEMFMSIGGSFNWRTIAGTERLSVHSFGAAVDINSQLGGYWRWSGATEGAVGEFDNRVPRDLVEAMERYGFIWGGKWHHFDGMHFEYRPELILYARLMR
ncbi:M15 family metallopeptidase [Pelagovum pacificum]|uniref:M15 family metallopeptidase n=1 Tax=Pelagovum pacificum TaxID=2588711 RepID=A0A5C5GFS8_9RHOB|nr:M15 family metallopeptidase [Pelagovum pacificum]QQA43300.1 M15 family metallopeptidase [Pelagovum pacificum]TNY33563.1 M15 family metallopeptidase [Pelagovum pacificum]